QGLARQALLAGEELGDGGEAPQQRQRMQGRGELAGAARQDRLLEGQRLEARLAATLHQPGMEQREAHLVLALLGRRQVERAGAGRRSPLQQRPAGARAEIECQQTRHQCRTSSASLASPPNNLNCVPSGWPKRPRMRPTMRWRVTIGSLPPAPACFFFCTRKYWRADISG